MAFGFDQGLLNIGSWSAYSTGDVGIVGDVARPASACTASPAPRRSRTAHGHRRLYARAGSNSQLALRVRGQAKFSRSGQVSVERVRDAEPLQRFDDVYQEKYDVRPSAMGDAAGVYVRSVVPANGSFKIHLSKKPSKAVTVGWIAFEKP